MISYEYSVAFSETLDILNHTKKEDVEKIPIKLLEFLRTNALKKYESKLDFNIGAMLKKEKLLKKN